jgi:hypothetical protein
MLDHIKLEQRISCLAHDSHLISTQRRHQIPSQSGPIFEEPLQRTASDEAWEYDLYWQKQDRKMSGPVNTDL